MIFNFSKTWHSVSTLALLATGFVLIQGTTPNAWAQGFNKENFGIEVKYPNNPYTTLMRVPSMELHPRQGLLTVNNPQLAGDFTALEIETAEAEDGVTIRLSILYNELKTYQWGRDKKIKLVKQYRLREGETIRTMELHEFGIEPIDMKLISGKPETLQPNVDIKVTNKTKSLDAVKIERQLDLYQVTLKNLSDKPINSYSLTYGRHSGVSTDGTHAIRQGGLEPGATQVIHFASSDMSKNEICITFLMFDDGAFEGDERTGLTFLAKREGAKLQAPKGLQMVEEAIKAKNEELETTVEKLEADFWVMPEALSKASAIEHLKNRFPTLDDKTISELYEDMKGEFYATRNIALTMLGELKRTLQHLNEAPKSATNDNAKLSHIRHILGRAKESYENLISSLK